MIIRLGSVILTILSLYLLGAEEGKLTQQWNSLFTAWLFCHFTLAIVYSKRQFESFKGLKWRLFLLFPAFISLVLFIKFPSFLFIYFGLHHILTEMYYFYFKFTKEKIPYSKILMLLVFLLQSSVYFTLFHPTLFSFSQTEFYELSLKGRIFIPSLLIAISFVLVLSKQSKVILFFIPEAILYIFIENFFPQQSFPFTVAIFYHLTFWFFVPLLKMSTFKAKRKFIIQNVIITSIFFALSASFLPLIISTQAHELNYKWEQLSTLWGFIHISYTFITSNYNPNIIKKYLPWS